MIQIPLQSIPSQSLSINLDNNVYDITIKASDIGLSQVVAFDISINNEVIVLGQRVVTGTPIIPYLELTDIGGNFILLTDDGDLPDYQEFQISQYLVFASRDEINAIT